MSTLQQEFRASSDKVLAESRTDGILSFYEGKWTWHAIGDKGLQLLKPGVYRIASDKSGYLWLYLPMKMLCRFDGQTADIFHPGERGLPSSLRGFLSGFAADLEGGLWFTLASKGVGHFDGKNWHWFTTENSGLTGNWVSAVAVDDVGQVWFSVATAHHTSFVWYDGKHWEKHVRVPFGHATEVVSCLAIDKKGTLWAGWRAFGQASKLGLWAFDRKGQWTKYTSQNSALLSNSIDSITVDKAGRIWAGTLYGFAIFEGTESVGWSAVIPNVSHGPISEEMVQKAIADGADRWSYVYIGNFAIVDKQGHVWALSRNGVSVFSEARAT